MKLSKFRPTDDQNIVFVCGASRTGTTLACALLDLSPSISMLSEFIFPLELKLEDLRAWLDHSAELEGRDSDAVFSSGEEKKLRAFIRRANCNDQELLEFLNSPGVERLEGTIDCFNGRLWFSVELAKFVFKDRVQDSYIGFKLNNSQIFAASKIYPNAKFLIISREPSSVIASQIKANMSQSRDFSEKVLQNYYGEYFRFSKKNPHISSVISLELLSRAPARALAGFLLKCGISEISSIDSEQLEKSSIVSRGHINAQSIGMGVKSIGSSKVNDGEVSAKTLALFAGELFLGQGVPEKKYGKSFDKKRKLNKVVYTELIDRIKKDRQVLNLRDLNRHCLRDREPSKLGFVRHDIDHDLDNAVKLAELDASLNISASYCVLHSAPYYGTFDAKSSRYEINDYCVDAIRYIQSLGHEINLHNNLIVMAARAGVNSVQVLENELQQWWDFGVPICGSSTHGDRLCKEYGFRNWELFAECDLKSDGNNFTQMILGEGESATKALAVKRSLPMKSVGLEYEAYDFKKSTYVTDSGGNLREMHDIKGHSPKRKSFEKYDIFGILTHPIWWNLD